MHKKRILWFIDLVLCIGLHIFCESWISFYLCAAVLFLPILSLLCSLPFVFKKKLRESHPVKVSRTKDCMVNFRIGSDRSNPLPCRLTICVRDLMAGTSRMEKRTLFCGESLDFSLDTSHCGRYEITVSRAVFTDFLGFFAFHVRCPEGFFVSVIPVPERPEPEPDFSHFAFLRLRPKSGGGYAENHELKEYVPGDPLNAIHWKLSAKTDETIVREPQDQEDNQVYLTLDRTRNREEMDQALGCLVWVGEKLMEKNMGFHVCFSIDEKKVSTCPVNTSAEFSALLDVIMSSVPPAEAVSLVKYPIPGATWRFHVNPKEGPHV